VRSAEQNADGLTRDRDTLAGQVDDLARTRLRDDSEGRTLLAGLDKLSLAAGSTAVIGPGLTVTVSDPGAGRDLSDVSKQRVAGSRQVILDRDLQLVVNSLWASGAEAVSAGGIRIGPNVTIRQAAAPSWSTTIRSPVRTPSWRSDRPTPCGTPSNTARG
jgi:uncharacterized protein YlxW (UPF0749 family)